jgi:hypothetical protein
MERISEIDLLFDPLLPLTQTLGQYFQEAIAIVHADVIALVSSYLAKKCDFCGLIWFNQVPCYSRSQMELHVECLDYLIASVSEVHLQKRINQLKTQYESLKIQAEIKTLQCIQAKQYPLSFFQFILKVLNKTQGCISTFSDPSQNHLQYSFVQTLFTMATEENRDQLHLLMCQYFCLHPMLQRVMDALVAQDVRDRVDFFIRQV